MHGPHGLSNRHDQAHVQLFANAQGVERTAASEKDEFPSHVVGKELHDRLLPKHLQRDG